MHIWTSCSVWDLEFPGFDLCIKPTRFFYIDNCQELVLHDLLIIMKTQKYVFINTFLLYYDSLW